MMDARPSGERGAKNPLRSGTRPILRPVETRRILVDGVPMTVTRDGEVLIAPDGRTVTVDGSVHAPPVDPTKIICVHLNYESRRAGGPGTLGHAPAHLHPPNSAVDAPRRGEVRDAASPFLH